MLTCTARTAMATTRLDTHRLRGVTTIITSRFRGRPTRSRRAAVVAS
jgi:hypothetical protein